LLHSSGWSGICYVSQAGLKIGSSCLCLHLLQCWDHRHTLPHLTRTFFINSSHIMAFLCSKSSNGSLSQHIMRLTILYMIAHVPKFEVLSQLVTSHSFIYSRLCFFSTRKCSHVGAFVLVLCLEHLF
jgi:hypothetical protein